MFTCWALALLLLGNSDITTIVLTVSFQFSANSTSVIEIVELKASNLNDPLLRVLRWPVM